MRAVQIKIFLPEWIYQLGVWLLLLYRKLRYGYAFRKIPLTQGKYTIVDPEDYQELSKYKWYTVKMGRTFYASRAVRIANGKNRLIIMHRQVLKVPEGLFVDHINHNGLDNRKSNLRICTIQQNVWNMRKQRVNCASKYKGVTWRKDIGKWQARITCSRKTISIGFFDDEKAAAMAYDDKAKELFGEYAALNL